MNPRSRHHLPSEPIGRRDFNLVLEKPFAVMVLVAAMGMAAVVLGLLSMAAHTPSEDTASSNVVPDYVVDSAVADREYPRTVTQIGRLIAIADTSVSIQGDGGAVLAFTMTPDTILVPAYGREGRPLNEQFVRNQMVVVIAHVTDGVATATAVVDPGPARRAEMPVPLILT